MAKKKENGAARSKRMTYCGYQYYLGGADSVLQKIGARYRINVKPVLFMLGQVREQMRSKYQREK